MAEALAVELEEVDAGQVGAGVDAAAVELGDDAVAIDLLRQPDDVDEPAAPLGAAVGERQDRSSGSPSPGSAAPSAAKRARVVGGDGGARGEHLVEPLELGDAERRLRRR